MSGARIIDSSAYAEVRVNSISAGFVPTHVYVHEQPDGEKGVSDSISHAETIVGMGITPDGRSR